IMESLGAMSTITELVKKLRIDRYWISRALESLKTRGLVEVRGGKVFRVGGGPLGGHSSGGN
ncbi:MAG: helix-turn-helix domain-containing protein, partial [Candidatus Korarchaeum sp.]